MKSVKITIDGESHVNVKEANKRVNTIIDQLAKKENVSVYPDGKEPLSWTQKMNNIKNRAEEIVLNEGIFC